MKIKDLSEDIIFNNWFSIEPEIAVAHWLELEKEYPILRAHSESGYIKEIDNLHSIEKEKRLIIFNKIKEVYKDKFPRWQNRFTSWWIHFHIFFNTELKTRNIYEIFQKANPSRLNHNLMNSMLFMKTANNKFYNREAWRSSLSYIVTNESSKWWATTYQAWYQTIEFRCNNIFDERIYWYYVWIFMLSYFWIKLDEIPFSPEHKTRILKWESYQVAWNSASDNIHFITFDKLEWIELTPEYKKVFVSNINKILSVLRTIWHTTSHDALMHYLSEYIPQCKFKSKIIDISTWKYFREWDEIKIVQLEWIRFVFKNVKFITRKVSHFIVQPELINRIEDVITLVPTVKIATLKYKKSMHA